jgi:hypothetical protein
LIISQTFALELITNYNKINPTVCIAVRRVYVGAVSDQVESGTAVVTTGADGIGQAICGKGLLRRCVREQEGAGFAVPE